MNRGTALLVLSLFCICIACALFVPIGLLAISLLYFFFHSRLIGILLLLYALPAAAASCFAAGPMIRLIKRARSNLPDKVSEAFNERLKNALQVWSNEPPKMGLIAQGFYWIGTTLYLIFYFPLLFFTAVRLSRFTPKEFHRNHEFSWFVLLVVGAYFMMYTGHLKIGGFLATVLVIVAVTQIFMFLKVHKGSILLYSFARYQMRLSIIGESAASLASSFGCLHYAISRLNEHAYSSALTISDSLYFSVVTFATVGYGDIYPKTVASKAACVAEICCGILVLIVAVNVTTSIWLQKHQPSNQEKAKAGESKMVVE
jgi:hypothetical protein